MEEKFARLRQLFQIIESAEASIKALLDGTAEPTTADNSKLMATEKPAKRGGRPPKTAGKKMGRPRMKPAEDEPSLTAKSVKGAIDYVCNGCGHKFMSTLSKDVSCPECFSEDIQ